MQKEITGWHVLLGFVLAFGIIISVNLTLAFRAIGTFPGLEVKNSYIASQSFDQNRSAQEALGWEVSAKAENDILTLTILKDGQAVSPKIETAIFGRATSVSLDQIPVLTFNGQNFTAPIEAGEGNWNLRIKARAENGTLFQQRIIVEVVR